MSQQQQEEQITLRFVQRKQGKILIYIESDRPFIDSVYKTDCEALVAYLLDKGFDYLNACNNPNNSKALH